MEETKSNVVMKTVTRNTLSKQVVERILHLLDSGQLKPGDRLPPEYELMELLNVSRPVLREALSSLEILEVITRRPRGGTFFNDKIGSRPFSAMLALAVDNLPAVIEARMALELGLVTIAAEKITDEQLVKLKDTIDRIASSVDDNYGEVDKEFHRTIAVSANNPVIEGMIDSLLIAHDKMNSHIKYREREVTVRFHMDIYQALANRDPYEAHKHMYLHLSYVRKKLLHHRENT
ncbi:FadR/GntR family transcriptional regulator [Paenibacillus filicis]|uniref:FadR/GntR family transcriptional regulator n=1 Tax=Paenibacillus gyeongsangnamensis TaxID=3388067 RepID=A0ABT4QJX9_9BACL|nr:FadR/GntR family transcriptional regulator [Paenibacillus filicis]MCZ8517182.1 FadR/GntR family transcriptional regulator [Paenibacillus filicis]